MRIRTAILLAASCPAGVPSARAQDTPLAPEVAEESGTVAYDEAYFANYDVQNAQDLLRRIPGVSSILASLGRGSNNRGFGSGGDAQILLNGRRFPGKSNDTTRTLSRLRADRVERVELIRGGRPDIDVQSTGLIVNIVLRDGATLSGGGTYELAARGNDEGKLGIDGLATYSGSTGRLGYNLGLERSIWPSGGGGGGGGGGGNWINRFRDETYFYPDRVIQELRAQHFDRDYHRWVFTSGATYDLARGARIQLNGLYETSRVNELNLTDLVRFDQDSIQNDAAIEQQRRVNGLNTVLEVSGEFTSPFWGGDLTVLVLGNRRRDPTFDDRIRIRGEDIREVSRSESDVRRAEYIGRIEYRFPLTGNLGINVGGEGAENSLSQDLLPSFDVDGNGKVEPVIIPTAHAEVDELRGEIFIDARWNPRPTISINGSLNYEYSDLTTNSVFNGGRALSFLRPRLDVRYTAGGGVFRFLAEREVSQLNFNNFVPRYNVRDDRIDAGNPGLLPERTWNFELGYEHRLPNDLGVLGGMVFYKDITDPIDAIPLLQGPILVSAQGNLEHASEYGAEIDASIRLSPIGLRDAVLTFSGEIQKSSVRDPFTGEKRRLDGDPIYEFTIGYRHDVRAISLSYGFEYRHRGDYRVQSDLFSRDRVLFGPALSVFAEKRLNDRLTLRGEAQNLIGGNEYRQRDIFLINQIDGQLRRLESYRQSQDLRYALIIKGTF